MKILVTRKIETFGDKEREDRDTPMFDAFRYEILNNSGVHSHRTGKFTSSNEIVVASIYSKDSLLEEMMGDGATQDLFEVELTKRSRFLEELDKSTFSCERHSRENKIPEHLLIPCTMQHEEIKENSVTGKMERMIQKELLDMNPGVCMYNDQLQTLIGDQSSYLNSVKAVPSDCGAAHMLASISETDSKDNATGGAPEETMTDPLP